MASNFPLTTVPNSLRKFLKGVPDRNVPPKVTTQYLKSITLKSSNDRSIIPVLKYIGLLDPTGVPSESYRRFRNKSEGPLELAQQIRKAYKQLFDTYDNAHTQQDDQLRDFFRANTDVGDRAINLIVATFKTLCEFADFGAGAPATGNKDGRGDTKVSPPGAPASQPPEIHINLQVHLPVSDDTSVYDSIFDAMARSLKKIL